MVVVAQGIQPRTCKRYVDDSQARFPNVEDANEFLSILNQQDQKIQYTVEYEDADKILPFLDLHIRNNGSGKYNFRVYRQDAITNVQIKPNSNINPRIVIGVFKGFLARAHRVCSINHLQEEIRFIVDVFTENGHDRSKLEQIAATYAPPSIRTNKTVERL